LAATFVLYRFGGHDGFEGVMPGAPGAPHHLELTRAHGRPAWRAPSQDHLIILYQPDLDV